MEEHELIELRSEEVQEILGTPPSWLLRWGTTLIVCLVLMMGWLSYVVKYPDIITAPVVIGSAQPSVSVLSSTEGNISKLFVNDNSTVKKGTVLAMIQSTAELEDVLQLENSCTEFLQNETTECLGEETSKNLQLGELQTQFELVAKDIQKSNTKPQPNRSGQKSSYKSNSKLNALKKDLSRIEAKIRLLNNEKLPQAEQFAARQRTLYARGNVTRVEIEQANSRIAEIKIEIASLERDKSRKESEIQKTKAVAVVNDPPVETDKSFEKSDLKAAVSNLFETIKSWKQEHLITAPVDGKVSFSNKIWREQQQIKISEELLFIIPDEKQVQQKVTGEATMAAQGAGKVKQGQRVVIMLESYPYQEFGTLEARVASISHISTENTYSVQLVFASDTLVTNYQNEIPHARQLRGEAQIVTEDKRFIQRIFERIRGFSNKY